MARIGKIARLPRILREQLNQRLADGEPAATLLPWLNENEHVQEALEMHFDGKPVTESNLSDWRQGGYEDWLRDQDSREFARGILAETEELEDEVEEDSLTDRSTAIAAIALLRLLREAQAKEGPDKQAAVLQVVRELQRLRRTDHEMRRVQIEEAHWEAELDAATEAQTEEMRQEITFQESKFQVICQTLSKEYRDGMKKGTLTPERAAQIREVFEKSADFRRQCSVPDLPPEPAAPPTKKRPRSRAKSG